MPNTRFFLLLVHLLPFMGVTSINASSRPRYQNIRRRSFRTLQEEKRAKKNRRIAKLQVKIKRFEDRGNLCAKCADLCEKAANMCRKNNEHDKSVYYYEKELAIRLKNREQKEALINSLVNVSVIYYGAGKYEESIGYNEVVLKEITPETLAKADETSRQLYLFFLFKAHYIMGGSFRELGNSEAAIAQYLKAEEFMSMIKVDINQQLEFYHSLGCVYFKNSDFKEAVRCFFKEVTIRKNQKTTYLDTLVNWQMLAHSYLQNSQVKRARIYYQKVLAVTKEYINMQGLKTQIRAQILSLDSSAKQNLVFINNQLQSRPPAIETNIEPTELKSWAPHLSIVGIFVGILGNVQLGGNKSHQKDKNLINEE